MTSPGDAGRHWPEQVGHTAVTVPQLLARMWAVGRRIRLDWDAALVTADYDQCATTVLPLRGIA
ncbi:hypothetical protein [Goodfellowiella coeruleoviolacea]|uniref:hypothetical protein n=1 Tax=Goodfellowiella coeruleoviolacea TaxID=334858 RepID=UPI0020A30642|nr:hypothetical protein [Goodfellowiella coeruleoviolacea]